MSRIYSRLVELLQVAALATLAALVALHAPGLIGRIFGATP